jgi:hypothetical protein
MGVIANRQTEVPIRARAGPEERVLAGPEQFHDRQRQVRKAIRICLAPGTKEGIEGRRVRRARQVRAVVPA